MQQLLLSVRYLLSFCSWSVWELPFSLIMLRKHKASSLEISYIFHNAYFYSLHNRMLSSEDYLKIFFSSWISLLDAYVHLDNQVTTSGLIKLLFSLLFHQCQLLNISYCPPAEEAGVGKSLVLTYCFHLFRILVVWLLH